MRSKATTTLLRLPNVLYGVHLGWVLGNRFLQLTHTGRLSGRFYTVVLEILRYNPDTRETIVMSGFGTKANWYANIRSGRAAWIDKGHGPYRVNYRLLETEEAVSVLADYERRIRLVRPLAGWVLGRLAAFDYDGTDSDHRRLVETLPLVAFTPIAEK